MEADTAAREKQMDAKVALSEAWDVAATILVTHVELPSSWRSWILPTKSRRSACYPAPSQLYLWPASANGLSIRDTP